MSKKIEKLFKSYRDQLLHLAKLYGIVEIKSYARSSKKLSTAQLELLLIKNRIKLPINRSSDKAIAKQELKENSIRNIYLSFAFVVFIGCLIVMRPFIKNTVNEVKFTYVAQEYKVAKTTTTKSKKIKKKKTEKIQESEFSQNHDNSISLNAETTLNLFEELGYDLRGVRAGQKVKPIYLTKLPKDLNTLGNTNQKRDLFIKIVLPLILDENKKITEDRKKLFKILNKDFNTVGERVWLKRRFKEYKIEDKDLGKLKIRMDIVPVSIALAQAANESGWGTSRFALEGNALFGQWTWSGEGLKPKDAEEGEAHKVMKFNVLQASVRAYQRNLNTHSTYKNFRKARAKLRDEDKSLDSIKLSEYLNKYAETGNKYVEVLQKIIKQNKLQDFDDAKLLPSSVDLESLI